MLPTHPSREVLALLQLLVEKAATPLPIHWQTTLRVNPMEDGGMGSLTLYPDEKSLSANRTFGKRVSDYSFKDRDGVDVIASLHLDAAGELFELEIWKTDFSPLLHFPETLFPI